MTLVAELPRTFDFFDNYNVRFVQPMERACSICMRRGEWGVDLGPADDLCDRCFLRAEQVVRHRAEPVGIARAQSAEPSTAVFLDGVLWESQEAYDAAQAAPPEPDVSADEAESLADPSDADLEALTAAAVAEAEAEATPATETKTAPASRRRRS